MLTETFLNWIHIFLISSKKHFTGYLNSSYELQDVVNQDTLDHWDFQAVDPVDSTHPHFVFIVATSYCTLCLLSYSPFLLFSSAIFFQC
jgi:hypothetical protein